MSHCQTATLSHCHTVTVHTLLAVGLLYPLILCNDGPDTWSDHRWTGTLWEPLVSTLSVCYLLSLLQSWSAGISDPVNCAKHDVLFSIHSGGDVREDTKLFVTMISRMTKQPESQMTIWWRRQICYILHPSSYLQHHKQFLFLLLTRWQQCNCIHENNGWFALCLISGHI